MLFAPFVSFVSFLVAACGGGDGSTNPFENGVENFTATIDGVAWNAEFEPIASNPQAGLYVISGVRTTGTVYTMVITLHNITGTGTYPLGVNLQVFGGHVVLSDATSGWSTTLDGAAGEIVITTLTATRIAGTFEFVADPLATGSARTVTDGQFDVAITGTGGVAAANQGSSITGSLGGAFTAAQVVHSLSAGGTPTLTIVANNSDRSVTMSIAEVTGADTYTLSGSSPVRTIFANVEAGNPTAVWRSDLSGGSGSVIISSMTADRIVGTFTATLVPSPGTGASGDRPVSGNFSLGRDGP
jgi:hypothetical protein